MPPDKDGPSPTLPPPGSPTPIDEARPKTPLSAADEPVTEVFDPLRPTRLAGEQEADGSQARARPRPGALEDALEEARASFGERGHERLITFYTRELQAHEPGELDKATAALYQHEIGELLETRAGDEGAAVKAYAKALQLDAALEPNLWAIRRVFERRQLWPNLVKLVDAEVRFARSDAERAELLVEKGRLLEDRLDDAAGAKESYLKATELAPDSLAAWMGLEKLLPQGAPASERETILAGLELATPEPGRRAVLLLERARLAEELGRIDQAIELCRAAQAAFPESERALNELERIAIKAGRIEEQVAVLADRIELAGRERETAPPDVGLGLTDRMVEWYRRQAALLGSKEPERAWAALEAALGLAPSHPLVLEDLIAVARSLGRSSELADLLARKADLGDPRARVALKLERAEALFHAGKLEEARACEAEVEKEAPGHLVVLIARERAALAAGDLAHLAELYLEEAKLAEGGGALAGAWSAALGADPLWAATAYAQAALLLGDRLGRDREARTALEAALRVSPGFEIALAALERLFRRTGQTAELAQLLERRLDDSPAPALAERLLENLITLEDTLGNTSQAVQAARRLVELKPKDQRARFRLVELDRAASKWADATSDLAELASLLEGDRRADVLLERAELLERQLADPEAAVETYRQVLELRPDDRRATLALEAFSRAGSLTAEEPSRPEAFQDLTRALEREAEASSTPERIAASLLKLAELEERVRRRPVEAARVYRQLLERVPHHPAALRGLARVARAQGDFATAAEALADDANQLEPAPSRAARLLELGELYEDRLEQSGAAEQAYARSLETHATTHAALARLRVAVARDADRAEIDGALVKLEAALQDPAAQAALLDERATLAAGAGDGAAAEQLALKAEALAQGNLGARFKLIRARGARLELGAVATELDALAAQTTDQALAGGLKRRAGVMALVAGGAKGAEQARRMLEETYAVSARAASAPDSALLIPLAEVTRDPDALAARAGLASGAAEAEWRFERAEALEGSGQLGEAALETRRVLELNPRHLPALELKRRLAHAGGDRVGWARATLTLAGQLADPDEVAELHSEAGAELERAAITNEAAAAFRGALDRRPLDPHAYQRARELLVGLYAKERDPGPLVELYGHRLAHLTEAKERLPLLLDRAELLAKEADLGGAERDLRAVLESEPDHPEALRRLGELLALNPAARAEAIVRFERYLELEPDAVNRRGVLVRLAALEETAQPEIAVQHLEAALEVEKTAAELDRLATLLVRLRHWQRAVEALGRLASLLPSGSHRAKTEVRVAGIYRDGFADPRAAGEALLRALENDPLEIEALHQLVPMAHIGQVDRRVLDQHLRRAIDKVSAEIAIDPSVAAPYGTLARLWGWRGDEDARAVAAQALALVSGQAAPIRQIAADPTRELGAAQFERAMGEASQGAALAIWRVTADAAARVYGPELGALGATRADRANTRSLPPAWLAVDQIAQGLGVKPYELYVSSRPEVCQVVGAQLVCGSWFAAPLEPARRFTVARQLALLRDRLGPVEVLDAEELEVHFAACAQLAELPPLASLGRIAADDARIEERTKALGKALGRKERKALAALGPRFAELPDLDGFRAAVLKGAARLGLAVGGDLEAALTTLGLDPAHDPLAWDLMRFATSELFLTLRREMGLRG